MRDVVLVGLVLVRAKAAGLDCLRLTFQRALGGTLHVEIERGVHLQALLVKLLPELSVELLTHPLDEVGRGLARGNALVGELERIRLCSARISVIDVAVLAHQLDDRVAALNRALGEANGIIAGWCFWQRSQSCCLGEIQVANRLAEVTL